VYSTRPVSQRFHASDRVEVVVRGHSKNFLDLSENLIPLALVFDHHICPKTTPKVYVSLCTPPHTSTKDAPSGTALAPLAKSITTTNR